MSYSIVTRCTREDGWVTSSHMLFASGALSVQLVQSAPEMYYAFVFAGPQTVASGHLEISEYTLRVSRCRITYEARGVDMPGIRPIDIIRVVLPAGEAQLAFCAT